MATIQDIFDWLNQGAQGDIPGTGGAQPSAPQASQPTGQTTPTAATPSAATPQDYSGDIPPTLLPQYQHLIQNGVPPDVAHHILTQPATGEGDTSLEQALHTWPYPYAGSSQEFQSAQKTPPSYQDLWGQLQNKSLNEQMNLPTYEQDTPGDDDNLGFTRLPSGQYVPGWTQPPSGGKKPDQQGSPAYQAGQRGTTGILDALFGSSPSQTIGDWLTGGG